VKIKILLNGESSPAVFRGCGEDGKEENSYQYILMPIKK